MFSLFHVVSPHLAAAAGRVVWLSCPWSPTFHCLLRVRTCRNSNLLTLFSVKHLSHTTPTLLCRFFFFSLQSPHTDYASSPPARRNGNPAPRRGAQVCCHPPRVPQGVQQHGRCHSTCRGAGEERAPTKAPRLLNSFTQQVILASRLCPGQKSQEGPRFLRPPPSDFDGQNNQLRPSSTPHNSGYRGSFHPSFSAGRTTGVPSLWRAHTSVVSTAS